MERFGRKCPSCSALQPPVSLCVDGYGSLSAPGADRGVGSTALRPDSEDGHQARPSRTSVKVEQPASSDDDMVFLAYHNCYAFYHVRIIRLPLSGGKAHGVGALRS